VPQPVEARGSRSCARARRESVVRGQMRMTQRAVRIDRVFAPTGFVQTGFALPGFAPTGADRVIAPLT